MKRPEILSPAGDLDSLKAAFAAGADAVYFGLPSFNARQRAKNIQLRMLPSIVAEAALRGIKLYITLNTLVTEDEIPQVLDLIDSAMISGIRTFIVQDMGVLEILRKIYPEAEIHISTQATTHTKGQLRFLASAGAKRVNLARELSLEEITELTELAHSLGIETEVFVHGSFCLSYSGQCYLCSFLEGTSGNRGLCQQNCRRLYRRGNETGYYLNLKDNSALDFADKLAASGADSFKIEGRIKSPSYVYSTVRAWKTAVENPGDIDAKKQAGLLLEGVFNRGFTDSYLSGTPGRHMFAPSPGDMSLRQFANVVSFTADTFTLVIDSPVPGSLPTELILKDNRGKFICAANADSEVRLPARGREKFSATDRGKKVYSYKITITGRLEGKITRGCQVFASRPALGPDEAEKAVESVVFRKIPATAHVTLESDRPFCLKLEASGIEAEYAGSFIPEKSRNSPVVKNMIESHLSRLGETPFSLEKTVFEKWEEGLFIPASEINSARRKCVSILLGTFDTPRSGCFLTSHYNNSGAKSSSASISFPSVKYREENPGLARGTGNTSPAGRGNAETAAPSSCETLLKPLSVIVDDMALAKKIRESLGSRVDIMIEINDPLAAAGDTDQDFIPLLPAVIEHDAEMLYSQYIGNSACRRLVINNTAFARTACETGKKWIAGCHMNITNSLSVALLSEIGGCSGVHASLELSSAQSAALAEASPLPVYVSIHSAVLLMTTRQCLFSGRECGKKVTDRSCYYDCARTGDIEETGGRKMKIVKRRWRYTELYDSSFLSAPETVPYLKGKAAGFIADLRNPGFQVHKTEQIAEIAGAFLEYIENPDSGGKGRILSCFENITKGNTRKGLG